MYHCDQPGQVFAIERPCWLTTRIYRLDCLLLALYHQILILWSKGLTKDPFACSTPPLPRSKALSVEIEMCG